MRLVLKDYVQAYIHILLYWKETTLYNVDNLAFFSYILASYACFRNGATGVIAKFRLKRNGATITDLTAYNQAGDTATTCTTNTVVSDVLTLDVSFDTTSATIECGVEQVGLNFKKKCLPFSTNPAINPLPKSFYGLRIGIFYAFHLCPLCKMPIILSLTLVLLGFLLTAKAAPHECVMRTGQP